MKAFRLRHPVLFWSGTLAAIIESAVVCPVSGLLARQIPYAATSIARYDLILPALTRTLVSWLPWLALFVGLSGPFVLLISVLSSGLTRPARVALVLLALFLTTLNLVWAQSVLLVT